MAKIQGITDDQLVKAYASGDNEAFDTLLKRHQDRIFNYILRIIKNEDIANDIFQETFVKAILTIKQGRYTENGRFPAWISRIAHNLIIDHYRQEKSENVQSSDIEEIDIFNRKDLCEATIEEVIIADQIRADFNPIFLGEGGKLRGLRTPFFNGTGQRNELHAVKAHLFGLGDDVKHGHAAIAHGLAEAVGADCKFHGEFLRFLS